MQEVTLSNDLTQLTTEIRAYQAVGNKAIFEIGSRIKKVKQEDLSHGQYGKWVESVGLDRHKADKFIKISDELSNGSTSTNLGFEGLYQIATMPAEERNQPQQLDSGEIKKPDEMTVRELRETKKKLKQSEEANKTLDGILSENAETISALEQQVKNKPKPEVVEKEVEVEKVPDDYDYIKGAFENIKGTNEMYKEQNEELRRELKSYSNQPNVDNSELLAKKEKLEAEISTLENVSGLGEEINDFINRVSSYEYQIDMRKLASKRDVLKSIHEAIDGLKKWCSDFENELPTQNFIEGEINHE